MLAFAQEETARLWLSTKYWLDQYIYTDIHEIYFVEFHIVFHGWLSRLETRKTNFQRREVVEWSDQWVRKITSVSNTISRVVEFLVY